MGAKVLKAINIDLPEWMVAELDAELKSSVSIARP